MCGRCNIFAGGGVESYGTRIRTEGCWPGGGIAVANDPNDDRGIRVPPQHLEAETAVLGAMMLTPAAAPRAFEIITDPRYFYVERHRHIFAAMLKLFEENRPIDMLTVTEQLRKQNRLEAAGGASYVSTLANAVPTAANLEEYARIVKEKLLLRELIAAGTRLAADGYRAEKDADDLMVEAQRTISNLASANAAGSYRTVTSLVDPSLAELEEIVKHRGMKSGLATGFTELDRLTMGLKPGELIIVAARPAMGKTALALNIAVNAARARRDRPVLIFSLEMAMQQLMLRLLCSEARVNLRQLARGVAHRDDWFHLVDAAAKLRQLDILLDDSCQVSPLELSAKARRVKHDRGLGLIVIDYLQLMTLGLRFAENRVAEIGIITRQLKLLAKELEVPILVLSQLNRGVESREDKRPVLSDLRDSGAIEQDADLILFIYREEYYRRCGKCPPELMNQAEIIIGKQRSGPADSFPLTFLGEYTRFENHAAESKPAG